MKLDDTRPIWIQLAETFRMRIAAGQWAPASKIPSVRDLALEVGANPNTIQRALGELDREGLTTAERAQGRFVTSDEGAIARTRTALATDATDEHIARLARLGLAHEQAARLLADRWPTTAIAEEGDALQ